MPRRPGRSTIGPRVAFAPVAIALLLAVPVGAHRLPRVERPPSARVGSPPPAPQRPAAPVAPRTISIANDEHSDYLWSAGDRAYRDVFLNTLDYYLDQIDATAGNAPEHRARFNCDGTIWIWEYERHKSAAELDRLIGHVRDGSVTVPLNALVQLYGAMPAEAVIRSFLYAGQLERRFGLRFPLVVPMENQTLPGGVASLWAGCGAHYAWKGICDCATRIDAANRPREVYRFTGPDGQSVVMKWNSTAGFGNQSIGGYAEARDPAGAIDILSGDPTFLARWPYSVAGAFGYGWDDLAGTTGAFVDAARAASAIDRKVVVSNEVDFFEDLVVRHGRELETFGASFGNEWDLLTASMGEVTAGARRGIEKLRTGEALACVALLNDTMFMDGRETERDSAMLACGLYYEHSWTSGPGVTEAQRAAWQRSIQRTIERYADRLQADGLAAVGSQVPRALGAERHFVFNPLGWTRTDVADLPASEVFPCHVVDLVTNQEVPSQEVEVGGKSRLRILARDVPPVGYRGFEVRAGAGRSFTPSASVTLPAVETPLYKLVVGARGQITSLVDRTNGDRELVAPGGALHDLGSGSGVTAIESAGPVSTTLRITTDAFPRRETRITLYAVPVDRIDVESRVTENFGSTVEYRSNFNLAGGTWRHEEVGMIATAARQAQGGDYADQNTRTDYLTLNHFADLSRTGGGITISSWDSQFFGLGASTPTTLDATSTVFRAVVGMQVDAPLGIADQDGDASFLSRFSFRPHDGFEAAAAMRFALEHQNPLVAGPCTGADGAPLPPDRFSLVSVEPSDVLLWALKPAQDGLPLEFVARVWNLADRQRQTALRAGNHPFAFARRVTHIETDLGPVDHGPTVLSDRLAQHEMRSWRLRMASRPTGVGGGLPTGLSFSIYPNPGPGSGERVLRFTLPSAMRVRAELLDVSGRRLGTLLDEQRAGGPQEWRWTSQGLGPGIYLVRLAAGHVSEQRRMVVLE